MPEQWNRFLPDRQVFLFIRSSLRDDLVSWGRGSSHEQIRRIATSKHLSELLEIDLSILPDIDEGKYVFKLLVLG